MPLHKTVDPYEQRVLDAVDYGVNVFTTPLRQLSAGERFAKIDALSNITSFSADATASYGLRYEPPAAVIEAQVESDATNWMMQFLGVPMHDPDIREACTKAWIAGVVGEFLPGGPDLAVRQEAVDEYFADAIVDLYDRVRLMLSTQPIRERASADARDVPTVIREPHDPVIADLPGEIDYAPLGTDIGGAFR